MLNNGRNWLEGSAGPDSGPASFELEHVSFAWS
jgi:hypothetical protein